MDSAVVIEYPGVGDNSLASLKEAAAVAVAFNDTPTRTKHGQCQHKLAEHKLFPFG